MDGSAYEQSAPVQVLRDRRGQLIGRLEQQGSTGRIIARDVHGLRVGTYDPREGTTLDARGLVVARGNILPALLVRR